VPEEGEQLGTAAEQADKDGNEGFGEAIPGIGFEPM
jgi:hypothetical protein